MRTSFVCAAAAAFALSGTVSAQTVTLSESEVLAQLSAENPRIQAARAGVDVLRAEVLAAGRLPNPRVTYNREAVAGISENMVMVSQALPVTGRRRLDVSAATARVEASSQRAVDQIRRIRADMRLAYTDLWTAQERERELTHSRDRLNELAGILGRREAAGDAAGFDRLRAEREVTDVDAGRGLAAAERAQAQATLASFLTAPRLNAIEAVRPATGPPALPTIDELMARAETSRGDLMALARDIDAAGFAEQAAGRRAIPEPEVVAGTKTSNALGGDVGSIVSVHVAIPLFDRAGPERAAARARGRQARVEADVLRQTIRAQIAAWRAAVVERRAVAERHRATLAKGPGEIERIAQVSYEAGERGILELLDAFRTASTARVRQTELDAAVREAEIELEFVSGWEIP
jgi:cobalt-zinc-cadmium efflux system outer membrane protein